MSDYPTSRPRLVLDFANSKKLDRRITFRRSSSGTYVGADGLIKTANIDQPRFDHDPVTGVCKGLLVEESRANLLTYSADSSSGSSVAELTAVLNAGTAPDGTFTATKLIPSTTATAAHNFSKSPAVATATNTYSIFAKAAGYYFVSLFFANETNSHLVVNLANGTIAVQGASVSNASVTPLKDGWFRISGVVTTTSSRTLFVRAQDTAPWNQSFSGDGTSGVFIWGTQIEVGSFPTSFIYTGAASVTRSADLASMTGANFSSWYRQDEGTLFADLESSQIAGSSSVFMLVQATTLDPRVFQLGNGNGTRAEAHSSGQYSLVFSGFSGNRVRLKMANAAQFNNAGFSVNGLPVLKDTIFTMPINTVDRLNIGFITGTSAPTRRATISRIVYWPKRLPDSQLIALTRR